MKDKNDKEISIGELVSVENHPELVLQCNWIILDKIEYNMTVDLILQNATTNEICFIPILDVKRQF